MHTDTATVLAGSPEISPAAELTRSGPAVPTVQWRRSFSEMEPLAGSWRELEARVESRSVLATFDYNATWYHHYEGAHGGDPLIGVARRGSDLVGIAPLVIRRRRVGRVPLTCVEFAAHEADAGEFLVEDSHPETTAIFLDSLVREAKFDLICLNDIDLTSDRYAALRETALRHRLRIEVTDHPNAIVDLASRYEPVFPWTQLPLPRLDQTPRSTDRSGGEARRRRRSADSGPRGAGRVNFTTHCDQRGKL